MHVIIVCMLENTNLDIKDVVSNYASTVVAACNCDEKLVCPMLKICVL